MFLPLLLPLLLLQQACLQVANHLPYAPPNMNVSATATVTAAAPAGRPADGQSPPPRTS